MGRASSVYGEEPDGMIERLGSGAWGAVKKIADNIEALLGFAVDVDNVVQASADAVEAKDVALDARDTAISARNTANTHKDAAQTARTGAETAQTGAVAAKTAAEAARDTAQASAVTAGAAAATIAYFDGFQNLTVNRVGKDEFLLTCPADAVGDGHVFLRVKDDFSIRLRPSQNNKLISIGLSTDGGYGAITHEEVRLKANGTVETLLAGVTVGGTNAYAANDYRWFDRVKDEVNLRRDGQFHEDSSSVRNIGIAGAGHEYLHIILSPGSSIAVKLFIAVENVLASHMIGYLASATGIQATSKTTAVTANGPAGVINLHNGSAIPANGYVKFTLNNNFITGSSVMVVSVEGLGVEKLVATATCADGGGSIIIHNLAGVDFTGSGIVRFMVLGFG